MKLNSFSHFRAVSIVFIVAGHALFTMGMQIDLFVERFFSNLIMGGTGLFVFISGFLFHHVFPGDSQVQILWEISVLLATHSNLQG